MGMDITVLVVDWSWLRKVTPQERLPRLRDAWYADETGLWDGVPPVEGDWVWPRGPHGAFFAIYEFLGTCGSFKAHFWAGERWALLRDHADPLVRTELDTLLLGLIWDGPDGEAPHVDPGFFSDDPGVSYGLVVARSPDSVRELAATWEGIQPRLGGLRGTFDEHVAHPRGWVGDFDEFTRLLEEWGHVLAEAAERGWGVVGLSE
ncbi:hypothetical protein ABZY19_35445 [Streptomyces sp. NPDC006475]|uniref:hypothetical protein n=1 Tax=Streptomyces sp. NPDC006475 TaxID=3155719 RepID=UPI0033B56E46